MPVTGGEDHVSEGVERGIIVMGLGVRDLQECQLALKPSFFITDSDWLVEILYRLKTWVDVRH